MSRSEGRLHIFSSHSTYLTSYFPTSHLAHPTFHILFSYPSSIFYYVYPTSYFLYPICHNLDSTYHIPHPCLTFHIKHSIYRFTHLKSHFLNPTYISHILSTYPTFHIPFPYPDPYNSFFTSKIPSTASHISLLTSHLHISRPTFYIPFPYLISTSQILHTTSHIPFFASYIHMLLLISRFLWQPFHIPPFISIFHNLLPTWHITLEEYRSWMWEKAPGVIISCTLFNYDLWRSCLNARSLLAFKYSGQYFLMACILVAENWHSTSAFHVCSWFFHDLLIASICGTHDLFKAWSVPARLLLLYKFLNALFKIRINAHGKPS